MTVRDSKFLISEWHYPGDVPLQSWSQQERAWLISEGSLTHRLRRITDGQIKLHVCFEGWGFLGSEECQRLAVEPTVSIWCREINWLYGNELLVAARVVIPKSTLTGKARQLQHIGMDSLGDVLFLDPHLKRSEFEVARLSTGHCYYEAACKKIYPKPEKLWARRSILHFYNKPLLVNEIFLPSIFQFTLTTDD